MSGLACVLSGGGAKAAAHIGAHRALEEKGLRPDRYVGTSMGAVIAACFAEGLDSAGVQQRLSGLRRADVAALSPTALLGVFSHGLLRAGPLRHTIAKVLRVERFEQLKFPLTVTAVDVKTGALELFGPGGRDDVSLVDALYASCALPVYYPHAEIAGRQFADGGLRAVLPLDIAATFAPEWIFAVYVGSSFDEAPAPEGSFPPPLVRAHGEAMRIMMAAQTEALLERWKDSSVPLVLVRPHFSAETTFALGQAGAFVEAGYRHAMEALRARAKRAR